MLILKITRVSNTHHTLRYERSNGTGECIELESKSFLIHDLLHFIVESEVKTKDGFFGLLEQDYAYGELGGKMEGKAVPSIAADIEWAVSLLTGVIKGNSIKDAIFALNNLYSASKKEIPVWFTEEFLERSKERYRRLIGEWNSLSFGETLVLKFE